MLEERDYCVGDLFKVYDKELQKEKFVVIARFVLKKEHFMLLSMSTFERWTDRELSFDNEFVKTRLEKDEVVYLAGDETITYVGNSTSISKDMFSFLDEKTSALVK